MESKPLRIPKDERIKNYLSEAIYTKGKDFSVQEEPCAYVFFSDWTKEIRDEIVADLLLFFYKTELLCDGIEKGEMGKAAYSAYIGALVGTERQEEIENIKALLPDSAILDLKGVYDFSLEKVRGSWNNLALLGNKLYKQCTTEREVFALCIFLLGMSDTRGSTVVLDGDNGISVDEERALVVPFFENEEDNIIFSLLSRSPEDIIVTDPKVFPERVLSVIRALGEK